SINLRGCIKKSSVYFDRRFKTVFESISVGELELQRHVHSVGLGRAIDHLPEERACRLLLLRLPGNVRRLQGDRLMMLLPVLSAECLLCELKDQVALVSVWDRVVGERAKEGSRIARLECRAHL